MTMLEGVERKLTNIQFLISFFPRKVREGRPARRGGLPDCGGGGVAQVGMRATRGGDGPEGAQGSLLHHGAPSGTG